MYSIIMSLPQTFNHKQILFLKRVYQLTLNTLILQMLLRTYKNAIDVTQ